MYLCILRYKDGVYSHTLTRIMSATIRDNITFSHEYDEVFYNLVLDGEPLRSCFTGLLIPYAACALKPDLSLMPEGDLTEVGEKGEKQSNQLLFSSI